MFFEPSRELVFGKFAGSEEHHHRIGFFFVGDNLPSVLLEKDVHQDEGDSLVAINKWMVPADMKPVGRSFVEECFVGKLAPDSDLGLSKSRVKQVGITKTWPPTVPLQEVGVNGGNNPIGDEAGSHYFPRA